MATNLNKIFTIGVDPETSDLTQSSRKFFIYDCLILFISTFSTGVIQLIFRDSILFGIIMISISLLSILALYLQSKKQYYKAIMLIQIASLFTVLVISNLSHSPFFPIFLIPIGLSFFIYFEEYKNPFKYFTIYLISGVSFSIIFFNFLEQPNVFDNPIIKSIKIIFFGILFLYKLFAITYIFKRTIQINSENEVNLKLSEYRYKSQFENNLLGMIVFGKKMTVEDVNPAFCKMIGYAKKDLIENRILEKSFRQDPALLQNIEKLKNKEINSFTTQKIFQTKNGYPLYTTSFISATYDQNGNFVNSNCSFLDITEKVEVGQQMNLKNLIVEGLIENFPAFYYCFDENLVFTECVGAGLKELGFKRNDIVGIKLNHLCKDYPDVINHHYNALQGEVVTFETVIKLKAGKKEYLEIKVFYDPISKIGTAVGFVVTEKKKAEIKIKQSEEQFRTLFEYAFDGIMIFDINKNIIIESNKKIKKYFDVFKKDVELKDFVRFIPQSSTNGQTPFSFLTQKVEQILTLNESQFEITHYNLSGKLSYSEITSVRLPGSQNHLFVIIFKDISEKKKSEKIIQKTFIELQQKNVDLQKYIESNNQLENFAYMASHDLKSPLRTISSYSQLLVKSAKNKLDKTELEFFEYIINSTISMSNLIENLLNYSKANSQNKVIEELNMSNLLEIIQHDLKADLEEKNVKLILPTNPIFIDADRTRIKQVFQNIICNAIKFIAKDKIPVIEINCQEIENHFQFSIKDNGIGIKPEFHKKIFMLFHKLHAAGDFEGTGIGLALCKKIIEQHGGTIWVESIYGEGTTFFFTVQKNKERKLVKNKMLKIAN